ncbi:MAG: ribosome hibernation-promoting factor, HPF/YfiA family [bacterium]
MDIRIKGRNIDVSDALENYIRKKLTKINRFSDRISEIEVMLSTQNSKTSGDSHKVEATVWINGKIIRAQESSSDMYASVDLVVDKLERRIKTFKGKLIDRWRNTKEETSQSVSSEEEKEAFEGELSDRIIRRKKLTISPMSVEEALLQMELLGHDFFVFINVETSEVNIVYVREEGGYGLIEIQI